MDNPKIIKGGTYNDERGTLSFVNEFDLSPVKRMYCISHHDKRIIRAWQGHQKESKWFKCIKGRFVVAWKKIDDFSNPKELPSPEHVILDSSQSEILFIPPGYANGLKALEDNSEIMIFSDHNLGESLNDKIRFHTNLWFDWNQFQ